MLLNQNACKARLGELGPFFKPEYTCEGTRAQMWAKTFCGLAQPREPRHFDMFAGGKVYRPVSMLNGQFQ